MNLFKRLGVRVLLILLLHCLLRRFHMTPSSCTPWQRAGQTHCTAVSCPRGKHCVSASPPSTHTLCVSGGNFFCLFFLQVRTSPTAALSWPRSTHSVSASPPSTHTLCVSGGTFDFCCCYKLEPAPLLLWVGREALTVSRPPLPPHTRSVSLDESSIFCFCSFVLLEVRTRTKCKAQMWISLQHLWEGITQ